MLIHQHADPIHRHPAAPHPAQPARHRLGLRTQALHREPSVRRRWCRSTRSLFLSLALSLLLSLSRTCSLSLSVSFCRSLSLALPPHSPTHLIPSISCAFFTLAAYLGNKMNTNKRTHIYIRYNLYLQRFI